MHSFSIKAAIDSNCVVGTTFLHVYAKCSSIKYASKIFDSMLEKNDCGYMDFSDGWICAKWVS